VIVRRFDREVHQQRPGFLGDQSQFHVIDEELDVSKKAYLQCVHIPDLDTGPGAISFQFNTTTRFWRLTLD
jgi:hypothetical protein